MAYYLVIARIKLKCLDELERRLFSNELEAFKPFGKALSDSLKNAKMLNDMTAIWEEEDYGNPSLQHEKNTFLNTYFDQIKASPTMRDMGWEKIRELPRLFPFLI